jgi:predicted dienelactone hydrolase
MRSGTMRLQDFWERMREEFGPLADSFARDHVMSDLGGRTVMEALGAGIDTKDIWSAVARARESSR